MQGMCSERGDVPLQRQDRQVTTDESVRANPFFEIPTVDKKSVISRASKRDYRDLRLSCHSLSLESTSMTCSAHRTWLKPHQLLQGHILPMPSVLR